MRDIWKEQIQAEQHGLALDGEVTTTTSSLAPKLGATTTTQPGGAAEGTVAGPVGAVCPSSSFEKDTFVKERHESSLSESSDSSSAKELERNSTKVLG